MAKDDARKDDARLTAKAVRLARAGDTDGAKKAAEQAKQAAEGK